MSCLACLGKVHVTKAIRRVRLWMAGVKGGILILSMRRFVCRPQDFQSYAAVLQIKAPLSSPLRFFCPLRRSEVFYLRL